ncbi:LysR family transcriptional regulator [Pseudomonas gingeri]|uniref:LysR family transcriptional regulator n=1 Tax=Pseudomonas gingeri TaxID=117681 RepID=UPI001C430DCE|nr:LysR family transcriptional regulator [Pseudomonas gingeri]
MLFEDLKAFAAVVECASLTRAAETLCLTQSAVSRRIQHLEQSLGVTLFDRTSRPPVPTAMGQRIYQHASGLLREADCLLSIAREDAGPSGRFRVGFTQVVADAVVFEMVTAMKRAFPNLEMQLVTGWSSELEQLMARGELDAATLMQPAPSSLPQGMSGQKITTLEILVVQSKQHPIVDASTHINNLCGQEWILNPVGCGYRAALEAAMGGQGRRLKLGVDTHGAAIQMRMIAAGLGLGLIPRHLLQASPYVDELSVISLDDFSLNMDIWIVHSSQPGNLKQANELLRRSVEVGFPL